MYKHCSRVRIRYAETDKMGYLYYGNYATLYEVGRVEALRALGVSYKSLEDTGIMMPVKDMEVSYLKPAKYDDEVVIETCITEMPAVRIKFEYRLFVADSMINRARTTLVFMKAESRRPCQAPDSIVDRLSPFFNLD